MIPKNRIIDSEPLARSKTDPQLLAIADNLAIFAADFGIELDDKFIIRLCPIAFTNGVGLSAKFEKEARGLENLLEAENLNSSQERDHCISAILALPFDSSRWIAEVSQILQLLWQRSSQNEPVLPHANRMQILQCLHLGLVLGRTNPPTAGKIVELSKTLHCESRFLGHCMRDWSGNGWQPRSAAFIQFVESFYSAEIERDVISNAAAEVYVIAKTLSSPWIAAFWAETGWEGGRSFARKYPDRCQALFEEAGPQVLLQSQKWYQSTVLGTASANGQINIAQATVCYFGRLRDPQTARLYCTGDQPRHIARFAFDFAFWMGAFSAHLVPLVEG